MSLSNSISTRFEKWNICIIFLLQIMKILEFWCSCLSMLLKIKCNFHLITIILLPSSSSSHPPPIPPIPSHLSLLWLQTTENNVPLSKNNFGKLVSFISFYWNTLLHHLTFSWGISLSYRNQSIDFFCK